MIEQQFRCDICGAVRGPSNHWLMVLWYVDVPLIFRWDEKQKGKVTAHLCGSKCAHIVLERYLNPLIEEGQ